MQPGDVLLSFVTLVPASADALAADLALLDAVERARAERFVFPRHRERYIVAHAALRRALAAVLDRPAASLRFDIGPAGKPVLTDHAQHHLHCNLSHAHTFALIGLARARPVGVDIEHLDRSTDVAAIVERFFSPPERTAWNALSQPDQREAFFRAWTLKEAYVKARGDGLAHASDRYTVDFSDTAAPAGRLRADELDPAAPTQFHLVPHSAPPGYVAAWCVDCSAGPLRHVAITGLTH